jgi:hypothetical protein
MRTPDLALSITRYVVLTTPISKTKTYRQWAFATVVLASELMLGLRYCPQRMPASFPTLNQTISQTEQDVRVYIPDRELIGELSQFDDSLSAYLMFDYYRAHTSLRDAALLISAEGSENSKLHVFVHLPADLIAGVSRLAELKASGLASDIQFQWVTPSEFLRCQRDTELFLEIYQGRPPTHHLEYLREAELATYLRRFIRFKSLIDPRVRPNDKTMPSPLSACEADLLAAQVVAVSRFYEIPTELMLAIGAMENNYLNVPGDLANTAWKRRPQPGDVILRRAHGRVLVRNDSVGVWQITRESLRYAHSLFLKDKRDYSLLPERLRPRAELDINNVDPAVLTTYAGLLLRDLLDHFQGDVVQAAGAYNGTIAHPNLQYAAGVEMIATYARRIIGRTIDLDRSVANPISPEPSRGIFAALNPGVSALPGRQ